MSFRELNVNDSDTKQKFAERNDLKPPHPIPSSDYFPQTTQTGLLTVIVLCVIFFLSSFHRLNHTDLWGHLCFGRWIVQQEQLPSSEPFAAAPTVEPFTNIPWLAQVLGYMVERSWGAEGLVAAHAILLTISCGLCMAAIRARGGLAVTAVLGAVIGYVLALPTSGTIRPQLFGIVLFPLVLLAHSHWKDRKWPLICLPILFAGWANLHGSFAVGLAALGCISAGRTWDRWVETGKLREALAEPVDRRGWWILLFCLAAVCLNPLGPRLLLVVAFFGRTEALSQISEWRPLVLKSFSGSLFFSTLVVTFFLVRRSRRRFSASDVLLLFAFGILALSSLRMLVWWAIVWPWAMAPHMPSLWSTAERAETMRLRPNMASANTMRTLFAMATVFMTVLCTPSSQALVSGRPRGIGVLTSTDTPLYVSDHLKENGIQGAIFAPMDWGDFLVWHTNDAMRPLVYTHVHLVKPQVWQDYLDIRRGSSRWLELADKYGLDYLLLSRTRGNSLRQAVQANDRTKLIYRDQQCLLFQLLPKQKKTDEASNHVK